MSIENLFLLCGEPDFVSMAPFPFTMLLIPSRSLSPSSITTTHIIQVRYCSPQALNTRCRSILTSRHTDIDLGRPLKAPLNIIIHLRRALPQIRPLLWLVSKSMLICPLCAPDYTRRCSGRIQTGVRFVAFVRVTELAMDFGIYFCEEC